MTAPSQNPEAAGLEPCPFCGGEAWLNDYEAKHSDLPPKSRAPQCKSCGATLGYLTTPAKATEAWNRRVTAASAQAAIDAEKAKVAELEGWLALERMTKETIDNALTRHIARADAAEARADRLAEALRMARTGYCVLSTMTKTKGLLRGYETALEHLKTIDAALQQETQK